MGIVGIFDFLKKPAAKPAAKKTVKPATKAVAKPAPKPVVKKAVKPPSKPVVKKAAKPATKPVVKKAVKLPPKPVAKKAVKPATKPVVKKAAKPATKPVVKKAVKLPPKPVAKKAAKPVVKAAPQKQRRTTPAFQPGRPGNKTAIVLSAPGSAEKKAGKPAAGQTGKNLNAFLKVAHKRDPKTFPSENKNDYTIVNATNKVHYKSKTGSTEASSKELNKPQNQQRFNEGLKGIKNVVALGNKAQIMVEAVGFPGKVLKGSHLSFQNINRNFQSNKETPNERAIDRNEQNVDHVINPKKDE